MKAVLSMKRHDLLFSTRPDPIFMSKTLIEEVSGSLEESPCNTMQESLCLPQRDLWSFNQATLQWENEHSQTLRTKRIIPEEPHIQVILPVGMAY